MQSENNAVIILNNEIIEGLYEYDEDTKLNTFKYNGIILTFNEDITHKVFSCNAKSFFQDVNNLSSMDVDFLVKYKDNICWKCFIKIANEDIIMKTIDILPWRLERLHKRKKFGKELMLLLKDNMSVKYNKLLRKCSDSDYDPRFMKYMCCYILLRDVPQQERDNHELMGHLLIHELYVMEKKNTPKIDKFNVSKFLKKYDR